VCEAAQTVRVYSTPMDCRIGNERPDREGEREQMARADGEGRGESVGAMEPRRGE
jgi:hypothetical protein